MRSLRCTPLLLQVSVLILGVTNVASFGYIDSLSAPQTKPLGECGESELPIVASKSTRDYLDSLQENAFRAAVAAATDTNRDNIAGIPDDHYAKNHPGAGWAGYKDPMYGGYLDHLSSATDSTSKCVFEAGKKADYGDDIRWGAQVYLDNLN